VKEKAMRASNRLSTLAGRIRLGRDRRAGGRPALLRENLDRLTRDDDATPDFGRRLAGLVRLPGDLLRATGIHSRRQDAEQGQQQAPETPGATTDHVGAIVASPRVGFGPLRHRVGVSFVRGTSRSPETPVPRRNRLFELWSTGDRTRDLRIWLFRAWYHNGTTQNPSPRATL
jgi:hypothetical protein